MKYLVRILFLVTNVSVAQELPTGHPPIDGGAPGKSVSQEMAPIPAEVALAEFKAFAEKLDVESIRSLPTQHNGRLKPLDTLARESILFISGSYRVFGLEALQTYLSLTLSPAANFLEIVELRDPDLRVILGFLKSKKRFSLADLEKTQLQELAQPLIEKEQRDKKSVTPAEKKIIEAFQQVWLTRGVIEGSSILSAVEFSSLSGKSAGQESPLIQTMQNFLRAVAGGEPVATQAKELSEKISAQPLPALLQPQLQNLEKEVTYNRLKIFFWAATISFLLGCFFLLQATHKLVGKQVGALLMFLPVLLIASGLFLRVSITGFAPVTNMFGTMIWVALGVLVFSTLLFYLYENRVLTGILMIAAGLVLFLTESIPLILSPDLDPIVAVLRSNYWLTIHVLTITISYAAFSIAMVIGNTALIRKIFWPAARNSDFYKTYSHYTYRVIQLGVFLLTSGIILGGIWADYSWGRFWGWDPKETWALIADVGFIAILHARHTGWLRDFGTLASSPVAYLLVIMAWYGVNFILATGLHSYGFSSGGATVVAVFVSVQMLLLFLALAKHFEIFSKPQKI